ncbi:hypothetical protein FMEAI12_3240008 [Parafrankia sp. Ea1.12]|uniref:hypothetical protein n=1 Tax=Parafrankia sp. Ea1.12 TaxID=573499 RepID=UPI000DA5CCF4|nr:hypothetical protein [Parafrankia sp. Ea1.12]SQD95566.1 hypothetical protein FMEAI12_3240008 [Parafrankia sp. Ea1.12]
MITRRARAMACETGQFETVTIGRRDVGQNDALIEIDVSYRLVIDASTLARQKARI